MRLRNCKGIPVSEIGFGAWAIGGDRSPIGYGATDDRESRAAVARALELGVTFFDTADIYGRGHSETLIGEALAGARDRVFLATKVGYDFTGDAIRATFEPEYIRRALDASLKRLRTDRVDLYQLHNPNVAQIRAAASVVRSLGAARFIGASIATNEEAMAAIEEGYDAIQLVYSYVETKHDAVLMRAAVAGVAVIAREPLARGLLTGKFRRGHAFAANDARSRYEPYVWDAVEEFLGMVKPGVPPGRAALKFVLSRPQITTAIPGGKTPSQVEANCAASDGAYAAADFFTLPDLGGDA